MARREVIEVKCDRCGKVETQNKDEVAKATDVNAPAEFEVRFGVTSVRYQDLCRGCRTALGNYIKKLTMAGEAKETKEPEKAAAKEEKRGISAMLLGKHG